MARLVRIAAVQFVTRAPQDDLSAVTPEARDIVLSETENTLAGLRGLDLDLAVFSEGVGAVGQALDDAEDPGDPGPFLSLYRDFASSQKCHVAGASKTRRGRRVYNSIVFFSPSGEVLGVYDKINLTIGEIEQGLTPGREAVVVDTAIGRIGGLVCFDLNFESLRAKYRALKPDILVFPSMFHGGFVQRVWAYECRSYFVCAWQFPGGGILDPFGRPMALTSSDETTAVAVANLDCVMVHLDFNQDRFDAIRRKYDGRAVIDIPANIGSALITSLTGECSAMDIVREFELELLDDYLSRSIKANAENR